MAISYDYKIVISGKHLEKYEYEKGVLRGYKRRARKKIVKPEIEDIIFEAGIEKPKKKKAKFSINRTRTQIRRIANANPQLSKFITLTFPNGFVNLKDTNYLFNLFAQKMKTRFSDFQYIAVVEYQKDVDFYGRVKPLGGSVHYHLLCTLQYVRSQIIADAWKHGFVKIRRIYTKNLGAYLCKYLSKDMFDERMFGKKKFFYSQDLKLPAELIGYKAYKYFQENVGDCPPEYEKIFFQEYTGEVDYKAYSFDYILPVPKVETQYDKTIFLLKKFGLIAPDYAD